MAQAELEIRFVDGGYHYYELSSDGHSLDDFKEALPDDPELAKCLKVLSRHERKIEYFINTRIKAVDHEAAGNFSPRSSRVSYEGMGKNGVFFIYAGGC